MSDSPNEPDIALWYDQRYLTGHEQSFGRPSEESVHRISKMKLTSSVSILDVACGQGFFLKAAEEAGHHSYGLDIAFEAVKIAKHVSASSPVFVGSGEQLPFPDSFFDCLTCWGALEHHPNMNHALAEFVRVTKPNGIVFLRVPNRRFWVYILGEMFGRQSGTEQQEVMEHLLSLEEWKKLLIENGLTIQEVTADNWFLQQRFQTRDGLIASLKLAFRKIALLVAPLSNTYVFDFLCKVHKS